jgi:transcriptional regulator with XRE-family HTH domain
LIIEIDSEFAEMEKSAFNRAIGIQIRDTRLKLELTQAELADKLGLDYQYISRLERGLISPTLFWLYDFTAALEINMEDFIQDLNNVLKVSHQ